MFPSNYVFIFLASSLKKKTPEAWGPFLMRFPKWGHLVDSQRIASRRSNLDRTRDRWCNWEYYLQQLRDIRRTLGSTTYTIVWLRLGPVLVNQFVIQAVVQRNTLMQSCCWKSTGALLSAKKVIIICFRIFLLTRCLAPTPLSKPQWNPVWRPWFSPGFQGSYATKQPIFFTMIWGSHWTPLVVICAQGPCCLQRADKQNYSSKPTTLARDDVFLHPSLGGRQS